MLEEHLEGSTQRRGNSRRTAVVTNMKANVTGARPSPISSMTQTDADDLDQVRDYYGSQDGETLVWLLRMGVRLAAIPLLAFGLPAIIRAAAAIALSFIVAFAVGLPFIFALASMTWRRLQHPTPARRFEPRGDNFTRDNDSPVKKQKSKTNRKGEATADDAASDDRVIRKVAVIGGGAAGLATLRQMLDKGIDVVLFERSGDVGGLWAYDNEQTSKVFNSVTQNVTKLHNRFAGYPAPPHWPLYLGHAHTLEYLRGFAAYFGLMRHVRLQREVVSCVRNAEGKFEVTTTLAASSSSSTVVTAAAAATTGRLTPGDDEDLGKKIKTQPSESSAAAVSSVAAAATGGIRSLISSLPAYSKSAAAPPSSRACADSVSTEVFDAVCVCSGQLSKPNMPSLAGMAGSKL